MKPLFLPAAGLLLMILTTCATNPVSKKKQVVFMSEKQEIAMGQEADPQIIAEMGLYESKDLQDFINEKGKAMAAVSHRPNLEYHFRVVDSDVLNAFAVPGGYVYFTRGIMAHFNNEAEFAGVLGHEIGHVAARHTVQQQRNQIFAQVGLIAGVILAPGLAQLAEPASQGIGLLLLKFGRDAERQSDKLGVEYSTKIGYDAREMAGFFKVLERESAQHGAGEVPDFLSTHPNPGDRNKDVAKEASSWRKKVDPAALKVNRNTYLKRIDGLIYGEDPRQGYLENQVFYHPGLKLQFDVPPGWQYQNTPAQVQLAEKQGKALLIMTMARGSSLEEAANGFLQQNKLQVVESRELTVNGLQALSVVADAVTQGAPADQNTRTLQYYIKYGDAIYLILGASKVSDFAAYGPVFIKTQQSFRELTDQEKISRQPERLRIVTAKSSGTLEQLLRSDGVEEKRLEEHAILNNMQLKDQVAAGTMYKVLRRG